MKQPLVALIDDSPEILELMAEILVDAGYRTVTGTDADEVEPVITREHPDLLIFDVRLPGNITGVPLLRALRANPATKTLPILVATADLPFLRENAGTLKALGCEAMAKPFSIDAFLGCVGSLLPAYDRSATA